MRIYNITRLSKNNLIKHYVHDDVSGYEFNMTFQLQHYIKGYSSMSQVILGLHTGHDASACVFIDGQLVAFCKEERVTRIKNIGRYFRLKSINEVLKIAGIQLDDIDAVAMTRLKLPVSCFRKTNRPLKHGLYKIFSPNREINVITQMLKTGIYDENELVSDEKVSKALGFKEKKPLFFTNHHLAHNLCSLKFIDWCEGLFLSCDGSGDNLQYASYGLQNGQFQCLTGGDKATFSRGQPSSASIGLAYSYVTELAGFVPNRHEGKITGLAAFGKPGFANEIIDQFQIKDGEVHSSFKTLDDMHLFFDRIFKGKDKAVMAASIQMATEQVVVEWVKSNLALFPTKNIALSGGVFSNVKLNQLVSEIEGVDEVYVFPAMGDEGLSVGCAVDAEIQMNSLVRLNRYRLKNLFYGDHYSSEVLEKAAETAGLKCVKPVDIASKTAELLKEGLVGAIFTQSMEMGPRALGGRTIMASPARRDVNDSINLRLERTEFMPFAPFVLDEDARTVFEVDAVNEYACRFMTITTNVKSKYHEVIPAVVHVDGTARPQIIYEEDNPLYYAILKSFKAITGIPCLVNTSFNAHEEPIINTPDEAVQALVDNRVDFLVSDEVIVFGKEMNN
jgi:carbamoyltransferase